MPINRRNFDFRDISMSFQINPIKRDLIDLKNDSAIARSLRNLVTTTPGERFFNENLGSYIGRLLFENVDDSTASLIETEIRTTISLYEPRVTLNDVSVNPDYENGEFNVDISYEVKGIDLNPQNLTFVLEPTR